MYIVSLVLAILAFICAFLPTYGLIITFVIGIICILLSAINFRSSKVKKIREVSIISTAVVIVSIVLSVIFNIYYSLNTSLTDTDVVSYSELVQDYTLYNISDVIEDEYSKIVITDVSYDGDLVLVDANVTFFGDERYFSNYDFYILDVTSDQVYFPVYESNNEFLRSLQLGNSEELSGKIMFELYSDANENELYLVYDDTKSKFKVQI